MKMGIAGAGMIAAELLSFAHEVEGLEITAICATARSEEKLKSMCDRFQIGRYYLEYDQMIADPEVEVVYVATPNSMHYSMCKTAIEAGKHVICEKPFTSNAAETKQLIELARTKGVILLEAISNYYLPNMQAIREHLPKLGEIKIALINYSQYSSRYDAFKQGQVLPCFDPELSGGALMDLNVYNIHLMVSLFGRPQAVDYLANIDRGIDTSGILTMDYGSFKAVCIGAKDCKAASPSSIQGDKGCLTLPFPTNSLNGFTIQLNSGETVDYNFNQDKHRMYPEFVEFVRVIDRQDRDFAGERLEVTQIVMDILTRARNKAGIVFPVDKREDLL